MKGGFASIHPLYWLLPSTLLLRLVMFIGRGDYVAFDEGWYLLLGRNLVGGDGYTLSGLQHTTLSPLFPILAGAVDMVTGDPVLAGRFVAAVASAFLLIPCWSLFDRLGGRRTALIGCLFVMATPALAPFVVPYWIGWDLWVGAEPLLHLFLFSALALALRADDEDDLSYWLLAGVAFAIAYLARPEAVIALGMVGLITGTRAVWRRSPRALLSAALLAVGFAVAAAPYWVYLHDVTGRWTVTGRGIEIGMQARNGSSPVVTAPAGATETIERMLWHGGGAAYMQRLYALDARTSRLASDYWGVYRRDSPAVEPVTLPSVPASATTREATGHSDSAATDPDQGEPPGALAMYVKSLIRVIPLYLWPLILVGIAPARNDRRRELLLAGPLVFMSVSIAFFVAADPRTQLLLAPLAAFYCGRGVRRAGTWMERRISRGALRRRSAVVLLTASALALLFGTQARWLYMSIAVGSPHHIVGAANREAGAALRDVVPADQPVMSWHPALALYADRDWRVLPAAPLPNVVRYANAIESEYVMLSGYYPSPIAFDNLARPYLLLRIPPDAHRAEQLQVRLGAPDSVLIPGEVWPLPN